MGHFMSHAVSQLAFLLRQTLFLSKILFSAETWVNVTESSIEELEKIDKLLLKRIFNAPSSTSIKTMHLESGTIPIKFILKAKRIMYFHYLLQRGEDELVYKVLKEQMDNPVEGDWFSTVVDDLKSLGLNYLDIDEIKNFKKNLFKDLLKEHLKDAALK